MGAVVGGGSTSACGGDQEIVEAEQALEGALAEADVLDIGEADGHFADPGKAFTDAQAAIGDHVPAQFVIHHHEGVGERHLDEGKDDADHFDDQHPVGDRDEVHPAGETVGEVIGEGGADSDDPDGKDDQDDELPGEPQGASEMEEFPGGPEAAE